jgi:uncharacterized protein YcaQ
MLPADLSLAEARRIAIAAQGLDRARPARVDVRHLRRVLRLLGLIQIDFVNVLIPAHYQVPFSRLGPYDRDRLDDLVYRRREFTEQWAHEASILPVETWPLLRHRMESHRVRPYGFERFLEEFSDYVQWVLREVRARGPLTAADLAAPEGTARRIPGAWVGTAPRAVLEAHFGRGALAVAERRANFARAYDVAERVIPREVVRRSVPRAAAQRELLDLAARAYGVATAADLADFYRMSVRDARPRLAELVASGVLAEVRVERWREPAYLHHTTRVPRRVSTAALLSPFDPMIWYRPRAARLFDFDYRIEIYVPREKRKWGYYVLPFLRGERLVARVDLKADRSTRRLRVLASYLESHAHPAATAAALAAELRAMATWLGLEAVVVARRGNLARRLAAEAGA